MHTDSAITQEDLRREYAALNGPLLQRLEDACHHFDFFHAVRCLDAFFGANKYPRIGYSRSRSGDPLHFGQIPFLEFAPRTIAHFSSRPLDQRRLEKTLPECRFARPVLLVYFFGLFGPHGPLPLHLTEFALGRQQQGDFTLTNFANLLQHRFLCFFYRAWASTRIATDLDHPAHQRFAGLLGSFCGLGNESNRGRTREFEFQAETDTPLTLTSRDWPNLYFVGHLTCQTRHAAGLRSILAFYLGVPCQILSFVGHWVRLPAGTSTQLGQPQANAQLGVSAVLGSSIWDCQMSFRIRLGPLTLAQLQRLLPGQQSFQRLQRWVEQYVGYQLHWDLQLVLRRDEVPSCVLGQGSRLGWTTFLKSQPFTHDPDDIIFSTSELA